MIDRPASLMQSRSMQSREAFIAFAFRLLSVVRITLSFFLFTLWSATSSATTTQDDVSQNAQKLEQLQQQISVLRNELDQAREQHSDVRSQLVAIEKRINKQSQLMRKVNRQIALQEKQLTRLNQRKVALTKKLDSNNDELAMQVRANYTLGRQEYLKLLLNLQNPATVSRTLSYYDYFNKARVQHINDITADLDEVQLIATQISNTKTELELSRKIHVQDKQTLENSRQHRATILAKLNQEIASSDTRLKQLMDDEQELVALIKKLGQRTAPHTDENMVTKSFDKLRGELVWPTNGKIIASYGSRRSSGDLQWKGVLIEAPEGSDVKAISYGHVIYANWLRGFGLLLIIDHGAGYMSLYGHNESIFKDLGAWVEPNEVIASVGSSGGYAGSGLYFEIRHNGKPTNPVAWLKK